MLRFNQWSKTRDWALDKNLPADRGHGHTCIKAAFQWSYRSFTGSVYQQHDEELRIEPHPTGLRSPSVTASCKLKQKFVCSPAATVKQHPALSFVPVLRNAGKRNRSSLTCLTNSKQARNHSEVVSCAWRFFDPFHHFATVRAWLVLNDQMSMTGSSYPPRTSPHPPEVPQWLQFIQREPLSDLVRSRLPAR